MVHWLWSLVPWWLIVIVAIIVFAFLWQFIAPVWAIMPNWLKWLFGFLASLVVAVQYGRNKGEDAAKEKRAQDNANAVETRKTIDAKVEAMPDSAVTKQLGDNKWLRD